MLLQLRWSHLKPIFFRYLLNCECHKILFSLCFIPISLDMDAALVVDLEVSELSGAKMRQLQEPRWPRPRNPLSRRCLKSRPCPICPQISGQLCQDRRDPQTPEGAPWACRPVHIKLPNLLLWLPPWTQGDQNNTFFRIRLAPNLDDDPKRHMSNSCFYVSSFYGVYNFQRNSA